MNIERWPLPVVGSGPFRNISDSRDINFESGIKVLSENTRVAVRIDLWSIDSMSELTLLEITSGEVVLSVRQEYGSLFAYFTSPNLTYRELILPEIKSGKNQILSIFEKSDVAFSSRDVLWQEGTVPFKLGDSLYFSATQSPSTLLVPGSFGSIHLRFASMPSSLESKSLFMRFESSNQTKAIVFDTFLLFFGFSLLALIVNVAIRRYRVRAGTKESEQ